MEEALVFPILFLPITAIFYVLQRSVYNISNDSTEWPPRYDTRAGPSKRRRRSRELVQLEKTAEKEISLYLGTSRYEGFGGNPSSSSARKRAAARETGDLLSSSRNFSAIGIFSLSWPRPTNGYAPGPLRRYSQPFRASCALLRILLRFSSLFQPREFRNLCSRRLHVLFSSSFEFCSSLGEISAAFGAFTSFLVVNIFNATIL